MDYRSALFIRFGGIGDILLATPSVRAVHRAFPGIEIDFVVGGGMADALAGNPYIRNIIVFDKRGIDSRLDHFIPFLARLSCEPYDLVVNLHPSAKSYLMAAASGARQRLTFRKDMAVDPRTGRVTHAIDDFAKELAPLGITEIDDSLDFDIPDDARRSVDEFLRFSGVPVGSRLIVINPAASRPVNRWPVDRFKAVAAHYAAQLGTSVLVTGAPRSFRTEMDPVDEVALAADIAAVDPRIVSVAGRLTVKELGALLARASTFLTCDTGPMHIGAAVGVPMVVLSGAADPDRTGPRTRNSTVVIDRSLTCVPCRARNCARGDLKCMDNISVDAVIGAINTRIRTQEKDLRSVVLPVVQ
jgi:ADP-heptose:LPS heptosyltransferase